MCSKEDCIKSMDPVLRQAGDILTVGISGEAKSAPRDVDGAAIDLYGVGAYYSKNGPCGLDTDSLKRDHFSKACQEIE